MPEKITIALPKSWADVTLGQYIDFVTNIAPAAPELPDGCPEHEWQAAWLPWLVRAVACFTGASAEQLLSGRIGANAARKIEQCWLYIRKVITFPTADQFPDTASDVVLAGERYKMPPMLMQGSTVGEWVESSQLLKEADGAPVKALPRLLCILLRKRGEAFTDAVFARERLWEQLPMSEAWRVWFFFAKQTEIYAIVFKYFLPALPEQVQAMKDWTGLGITYSSSR